MMLINIPSLENLDRMTIHEYLSIHLLASDDHLTPMRGPWFYILLRVKCALFLHDSCSSSQQTPKAHNLRKILWIVPQKMVVKTLENVACLINLSGFIGCLQHEIHGATPILLFIPLNDHSLERFSSVSCVEPSFVPTSWFHGCLDLAIGMSPFQDFCTRLFSGPIHREAQGGRLALLQTVSCYRLFVL